MPFNPPGRGLAILLAVAGGVACDAGFPGQGWWPLTFAGIALLFLALGRDSARWNALVGFAWGSGFYLPHLVWADAATGLVPWIALTLLCAGMVGLFGVAWSWARRGAVIWSRARIQVPAFAIVWVGMEELQAVFPFGGFPWGRLAFSQADSPLGRWAWVAGTPLVSALVAVVGAVVALAVLALRKLDIGTTSGHLLLAGVVVASGWLLPLDTAPEDGRLNVAAVQGNVPDRGLDSFSRAWEVLHNHVAGTYSLLDEVEPGELDIVLWPENSSDIDPRTDDAAWRAVQGVARAVDAPILVGTDEYPETGGRLNVSLLWDPGRGPVGRYVKQHPAPFGEYIPMREFARLFSEEVDRVRTDMLAGSEPGYLQLDSPRLEREVGIGTVICFEVAYDDLVRDAVTVGAELLVVQTNNASFGRTDESTQQLAMSRLRAIEHGRATVQISTVGVSAIISPNGVVRERTGLFTAEQMIATLPLRSSLTPATRIGDEVSWVLRVMAVAVTLAGMAGAARIRRAARASGPVT